jgi:hypothetical protein
MAQFRNRRSLITQIGILRLQLHGMNNSKGMCLEDARKEGKKLYRAPESEVKQVFADLKHEWERPRKELEA